MYHIVSFNLSRSSSSCIFSFDVSPPFKIGTCRVGIRSHGSYRFRTESCGVIPVSSFRFVRRRARNYHHYRYCWHRPAVAVSMSSRPRAVVWETIPPTTMTTVRRYRLLRVAAVARAVAAGTPVAAAAHTAAPVAVTIAVAAALVALTASSVASSSPIAAAGAVAAVEFRESEPPPPPDSHRDSSPLPAMVRLLRRSRGHGPWLVGLAVALQSERPRSQQLPERRQTLLLLHLGASSTASSS